VVCGLCSEGRRSALSSVSHELRLTLLLRSSHLAAARHEAFDFLGAHGVHHLCIEDVLVALTEATANAVMHSGVDVADVHIALLDDHIRLVVSDRGRGFDVAAVDLSQRPGLLSPGGRGLYLISCLMDSVHIDGRKGTTITMIKNLRPADCFPRG
jgi:anti-sigma regulatory factor (Ser/Thr protein kinase)